MNTFSYFHFFSAFIICIFEQNTYLCITFKTELIPTKRKDSVAQLVEQYTFNVWVLGSNPSGITKKSSIERLGFFLYPIG